MVSKSKKLNNKTVKYKAYNRKLEKFRSMLSTVKYVAKNVIYLKGWSNEKFEKKESYLNFKNNINFKFKN